MGYQGNTGGQISNLGGMLGAKVAHHLKCLYGLGAWVITVFLLVIGGMVCTSRSLSGMLLRGFGAILLTTVVCTWAGTLSLPGTATNASLLALNGYPAGLGGLVGGRYLGEPLAAYFGEVGVYLVLVTAGVLAGLLTAQHLTEVALATVGRTFVNGAMWTYGVLARLKVDIIERLGGMVPAAATGIHPGVKLPDVEPIESAPAGTRDASL